MENEYKELNFIYDEEKMYDFERLTKEEFLTSYSYLTEDEYNNTKKIYDIARDIIETGMLESSEGNYIVYTEGLSESLGISEEYLINHYDEIAYIINTDDAMLDPVQGKEENCFDMSIGLAYIYDYNWEEDDEVAPSVEIQKKIRQYYNSNKYEPLQLIEIQVGLIENLDVSLYDNPKNSHQEMRHIREDQYRNIRRKSL